MYTTAHEKVDNLVRNFAKKCQFRDTSEPAPDVVRIPLNTQYNVAFSAKEIRPEHCAARVLITQGLLT